MNWEYNIVNLTDARYSYLSSDGEFDSIIMSIKNEMKISDCTCERSRSFDKVVRYGFKIEVSCRTFDIFFNSKYGYRAQYFLNRAKGEEYNRKLISELKEDLIAYAKSKNIQDNTSICQSVENSLSKKSAKIWIHQSSSTINEKQHTKLENPILSIDGWLKFVKKVEDENELLPADRHVNFKRRCKSVLGVRAPLGTTLEIKGAFLTINGEELIPTGKQSRARQIKHYGFS